MAHADNPVNRVELRDILQQARRRWRLKLALRGAAAAFCAGLAVVLVAALAIEFFKFNPAAILAFRIVVVAALLALVGWFLVRPLLRRVSDEQVALYLEERHPALDAAVVSAIDPDAGRRGDASRALVRRLIDTALDYCRRVDAGRDTDRVPVRRYGMVLGAAFAAALVLMLLAPTHLRHSASALLNLSRSVEAASPYRIEVTPGNVTVARGADQAITAQLSGFASEQAALFSRQGADAQYERLPMLRDESGAFEAMLFDLGAPLDYFVESDGIRSPVFKLNVIDLPYVKRLDLEYLFPQYTGLPSQTVEDGGDVAVLRGTEVRLHAITTMRAPGGRILLNDSKSIPLSVGADGTLRGSFTVEGDGFYRIELQDSNGKHMTGSPQYTIDALTDQTPLVSFSAPRRDVTATPIEEVFVEAQADDDFGVRDLQLVYSVNGGPEKSIRLFGGSGDPAREVSAGHTFYLEELGLQAGDFVSYFARVRDNDVVAGPKSAASDLYFVRVRPFRKEFRPAESQAGGGGGGAAAEPGGLSQQQRQIIAGTFNVTRDRKNMPPEKLRESLVVLGLAQARLREQVEELASRMTQRLEGADSSFGKIAELLPKAAEEMRAAEAKLQARAPEGALPPEQRALQHLQRAEEEYQLQVSVSRNSGGGGGGGAPPMAEDLADLFDLEMDRMANQYETAQRAEQLEADRQLDEVAEKLKELARRQEQEAERERRRAAAGERGTGGGASQRALADQTEEMARRLERLAREEERPDLMAAARRLQEAADAMRRAAASGEAGEAGQAGSALERLRDAAGRLDRERDARAERDIGDALREAEALAREQGEIAREVNGMGSSGASRQEQMARIGERKDQLQNRVAELERHLDRTAADIRGNERDAARKAQEAAAGIRDNKIKEKIRYSKNLMRGGAEDYARALEQDIGENLEALRDTLGEAQAALGQRAGDPKEDALERARQLARGLDSLERRMGEGRQQDGAGRAGGNDQERGERSGEPGGEQRERQADGQRGGQGEGQGREGSQASGETTGGAQAGGQSTGGPQGGGAPTGGSRRPGNFSPEDVRQFRGEFRRWSAEAQELARGLREQGMNASDVEELLRSLRALDSDRVFRDPEELQRLQSLVAEGAKRVEFRLRREAGADAAAAAIAGSDEVPPEFRKLVEEYYRTLAKTRGGSK
jgi:hypothetical protein